MPENKSLLQAQYRNLNLLVKRPECLEKREETCVLWKVKEGSGCIPGEYLFIDPITLCGLDSLIMKNIPTFSMSSVASSDADHC